ncbi:hypothetical protein GHK01_31790 [Sinorhizobium meliloti]|nr:hypothetical protein [Sinorhizobium meliloti]
MSKHPQRTILNSPKLSRGETVFATAPQRTCSICVVVRPKSSNSRIIAQAGAFIIYGLESRSSGGKLYRRQFGKLPCVFRPTKKGEIREQLARLGTDASVLFPELDKAAEIISLRHRKREHLFDI